MPRLTAEQFLAYKNPGPLAEDFPLPDMGGDVHILGITDKAQREAIAAEIKRLSEGLRPGAKDGLVAALGLSYTPDADDIMAAVWASACVTDPKLSSTQWLKFGGEGYAVLGQLMVRAFVCSRIMADPTVSENAADEDKVPDGVDAATGQLKEMETTDPLV